ncbi:adrenodoxin-like protein 2, mitochondrial [Ipomoea triloba]|uniref:adrenodoxin-like protein 2, mitochondrial n=1 Tax=Ipomoea triloba TaxID=35885 RepID=UPI00125DAB83|nr:adrenodoxin-like protein 2, mitochondrial [Ipomoea triloba]
MVLSNIHRLAHLLSLHSVAGKLSLLSVCRGYSTEKCCIPNLLIDSNSSNEYRSARECYRLLGLSRNGTRLLTKGPSHWRNEHFCTAAGNSDPGNASQKEKISVTFVDKDGEEQQIKVPLGMSMLEAAHENDIELEGACEGSLACSTCHVIVMDMEYYNKLEDPEDEENDMLDLAFGLTETSRLGCQIIAKPELNGIRLAIPAATRNFAVDGFKPKPH